jgi:hypothetical protein
MAKTRSILRHFANSAVCALRKMHKATAECTVEGVGKFGWRSIGVPPRHHWTKRYNERPQRKARHKRRCHLLAAASLPVCRHILAVFAFFLPSAARKVLKRCFLFAQSPLEPQNSPHLLNCRPKSSWAILLKNLLHLVSLWNSIY